MKPLNSALKWIILLIFILALVSALAGIWPGEGQSYSLSNFRGEEVTINARGLHYMVPFLAITLVNVVLAVLLLRNIDTGEASLRFF